MSIIYVQPFGHHWYQHLTIFQKIWSIWPFGAEKLPERRSSHAESYVPSLMRRVSLKVFIATNCCRPPLAEPRRVFKYWTCFTSFGTNCWYYYTAPWLFPGLLNIYVHGIGKFVLSTLACMLPYLDCSQPGCRLIMHWNKESSSPRRAPSAFWHSAVQ